MSKETLKLALEGAANYIDALGGDSRKYRQALAKPDFWEGYVPEPVKPAQQDEFRAAYIEAMVASNEAGFSGMSAAETIRELSCMVAEQPAQQEFVSPGGGYVPAIPAQQALDKKAENARELGLDYEPARDSGIVTAGGADPRTQRTWVGLTDDEMYKLWLTVDEEADRMAFGKAIEAKLRSKNEDRN